VANPDDSWPADSDDHGGEGDRGEPGRDGPVTDAQWDEVVSQLNGTQARGTLDSLALSVPDEMRASAQAQLAAKLAAQLAGEAGPGPSGLETGMLGAGPRVPGWRDRCRAAVDRWLRRPPATLMLPTGSQLRFTIGREPDCDMTLADRTVSRLHASLKREDGGWLLTDLGSTNGTKLNGWRVSAPITVTAGDLVSFGGATFVLADRPGALP
jgi:hypothetical protein